MEIYFFVLPYKIFAQFLVRSKLHLLSLLFLSLGKFALALALYQSNVIGTLAAYQEPMSFHFATRG
jgi:hypothetical protein